MANNALFEPAAGTPTAWPDNRLLAAPPSMADAYEHHAKALQQWMAEQRASGVAAGTNDPETGWPTQKGIIDGVRQWGDAMIAGTNAPGFRAYHASPYSFGRFDNAKIGSGEGAQAYGHGHYLADSEVTKDSYLRQFEMHPAVQQQRTAWSDRVSTLNDQLDTIGMQIDKARRAGDDAAVTELQKQYRPIHDEWSAIQNKAPKPVSYEVQVNADPAHFLDWDKPLSEQHPKVRDALLPHVQAAIDKEYVSGPGDPMRFTGGEAYSAASSVMPAFEAGGSGQADISAVLQSAGIPGIRYLDGGSRADGAGTSNHVIFDPATIEILRKYGIAGLIAGGGAAAATGKEQ